MRENLVEQRSAKLRGIDQAALALTEPLRQRSVAGEFPMDEAIRRRGN
jgi:hypothetical protein